MSAITAPTNPGGGNTQVQFNDAGKFGGDASLTYDKGARVLAAGSLVTAAGVQVNSGQLVSPESVVIIAGAGRGDGSDDRFLALRSAPDSGDGSRGAQVVCYGNEVAGAGGRVSLLAGAAPTAAITINRGIQFPSPQVVSTDPFTLDDYREGQWAPVLSGAGGGSGQSYVVQSGIYQKVGRWVSANFYITIGNIGTLSGNLEVRGLPFASDAGINVLAIATLTWHALTAAYVSIVGSLDPGTSVIRLTGAPAASTSNAIGVPPSSFASGSVLAGSVRYQTAN